MHTIYEMIYMYNFQSVHHWYTYFVWVESSSNELGGRTNLATVNWAAKLAVYMAIIK